MTVAPFVTHVPLRWTDQDAYRHLNHAKAVTVLEEARIDLLFDRAARDGQTRLSRTFRKGEALCQRLAI